LDPDALLSAQTSGLGPVMEAVREAGSGIVVIGSSAGGLHALEQLLADLPPGNVPVVVVQHLDPRSESHLVPILARHAQMPVRQAEDGQALEAGVVSVGRPDHHLLVTSEGHFRLDQSETVHFVRPSIDLLFESAATCYGVGVVAVVLTGMGRDGAQGVEAVHRAGGTVLVQEDAEFGAMPAAALATDCVDEVLPLARIAARLVELTTHMVTP
jgi:two-component system, chemotaxis family, protein-glutamate methylesterase/glutaminase